MGVAFHTAWGLGQPGLFVAWGAATPFWNSVSLKDKKLAVTS